MQNQFATFVLKTLFKTLGRSLSLLAVLMLIMAGGTFAHANDLPHQHFDHASSEKPSSSGHHDHLSDGAQDEAQFSGIHCGADIHCLSGDLTYIFLKMPGEEILQQTCKHRMILSQPDPPPPRLFS